MFRIVARLRRRARTIARRSPWTSVIPALSIATSVPVPMAMPTAASASAGTLHHRGISERDRLRANAGDDAFSRNRAKVIGARHVDAPFPRRRDDRVRERVLARLLDRRREPQRVRLGRGAERYDGHQLRL